MEHFFELPVTYKDEELILNGRLVTFAYAYKFYIMVEGIELEFERDDNGEFRALILSKDKGHTIDAVLVAQIIGALETVQSM